MKRSMETDRTCIEKILKYIKDIEDCFGHFNIESYKGLENQRLAQLAITQSITNLHEIKKNISKDVLDKINEFDKIKISTSRNIASHDYDSVNFKVVYDICIKLTADRVSEVLKDEYYKLGQENN